MKSLIKSVLSPVANRHYTNKKTSAVQYAFQFFPFLLICLFGALFVSPYFWLGLIGMVIYGVLDYLIFDAFVDKLTWKFIWKCFYSDAAQPGTPEQNVMKQFEQNPTAENYTALEKHLQQK